MSSENRPYILALKFSGPASHSLNDKLNAISAEPIKVLFIGSDTILIGIMWPKRATQLWDAVVKTGALTNCTEIIVLESGRDWCTARDKSAHGWLMRHVGTPTIDP